MHPTLTRIHNRTIVPAPLADLGQHPLSQPVPNDLGHPLTCGNTHRQALSQQNGWDTFLSEVKYASDLRRCTVPTCPSYRGGGGTPHHTTTPSQQEAAR